MKLHTALFLFLASVSISAARADSGALTGHWQGTVASPGPETTFDLQIDEQDGVYLGNYSTTMRARTSFPIARQGQSVRFAIPNVGVFEGQLHGDVLEGNIVTDEENESVRFEKGSEPGFRDFVL